ncbi:sulfotransferase [Rhodanobacter panaciterrae]|uniref:Sulfotransferase n=1 Tax=Rhodanobacter panaciterrae TaxID=490572 RepID=A0ABQ3A2N6_9GAMM|nr:tetratricopeptide repeat-containing sulfotransferase family protein [Rhodanobacter panaciterrae]GGY32633.1 sulfotransferase [Rhodanobacter panaciterrae]
MAVKLVHRLMQDRAAGLSPAVAQLLDEAATALTRNELNAAETNLLEVLTQVPDCVEAQRLRGLLMHLRGDYAQAVLLLRQALALSPEHALIHMNLGISQHACGEVDAALVSLQRASKLAADFAPAWFNLGRVLSMQGRPVGAVTALHRTLDIDPDHVAARVVLAEVQTRLGALDLASTNYREVLRRQPGHADAWIGLANLPAVRFDKDDVVCLRQALQMPQTPQARVSLGFALTRALEDQADYRAAFRALYKANAQMRRLMGWDAAAARAKVSTMLDMFAAPMPDAPDAALGEEVIFLVSLPQSGADVTTQILARHPQVGAVDALPDLQQVISAESARCGQPFAQWARTATATDWARLGQDYLARTASARAGKPRFVDANPLNWRLVGAALAMLPGARVVNSRGDALETCFACYRQLFANGHEFSYDLDHIASYWRDYDRLSRHWQRLFPQRFLEYALESLSADPAVQVRRLLAFCGLDYDPACLAFHHELPSARSALYGRDLDRLKVLLGAA